MLEASNIPVALTIAGSDSAGGAGIQADLKTFVSLGVHGTSAITCITAQNPSRVYGIHPCPAPMVRRQIEAVYEAFHPSAVKTGMLYSAEIIRAIATFIKAQRKRPLLVLDPVMISTSGKRLLKPSAEKLLKSELLPLAALVTPNLDEAVQLTGREIRSVEEMRAAAREIREEFGCAALVKGGHMKAAREAVDLFYDGATELLLKAPFVKGVRTHGTGCTYSAAVAGYIALGFDLEIAVVKAKGYITAAIAGHQIAAGKAILNTRV